MFHLIKSIPKYINNILEAILLQVIIVQKLNFQNFKEKKLNCLTQVRQFDFIIIDI